MAAEPPASVSPTRAREVLDARVRSYVRPKQTPRRVILIDRLADLTISVGGLAVIVAVFGIMAFLVEVVVPLFRAGSVLDRHPYAMAAESTAPLLAAADEYNKLGMELYPSGRVRSVHIPTGRPLSDEVMDLGSSPVSSFAKSLAQGHVIFGFEDGTVRFGRLVTSVDVIRESGLPASLQVLDPGDRTDGTHVFSRIPGDQYRKLGVSLVLEDAQVASPEGLPIVSLDYRRGGSVERPTRTFLAMDATGAVRLTRVESRMNLLTRKLTSQTRTAVLPVAATPDSVVRVLMTDTGDEVYLAHRDGRLDRFDLRDFARPILAESRDVIPADGRLTAVGFLIGEQSIVVGGSDGRVDVYFRVSSPDATTTDGRQLVLAHQLEPHEGAVRAFSASQRSKLFATGDETGAIWIRHATSERVAFRLEGLEGSVVAASLSPRDDGVLGVSEDRQISHWGLRIPHPETTLGTIFGKVWYEGYPEPSYTWQSSAGTDVFEPKFSLVPLIFGTIKATVYSLLFAIPIALLAAVYTSEFVHPRVRATVKPAMEMMASLPSVVLGFLAALVLAPLVETWIASVILVFVALPVSFLLGAMLWQVLPQWVALRLEGLPKFACMFLAIAAGCYVSFLAGPLFEQVLFHGDVRLWLDGTVGTGRPFLFLVLLPLSFLALNQAASRGFGRALDDRMRALDRSRAGLYDGARWLLLLAATVVLSYALASALVALGVDPRGGPVGTYVQRNTLVVGFAMGFAVIPIIYTISEDAMSAVPAHLRAASLACGATQWQTATSVIIPTAMSGIFAAVMIGMGRAVGETMIVVMAAGNTPILDWNVFNGLRALSANIAVELPEAVKDGTLYRMLFLAALTLFIMTFVVNTVAELVRLRFRRRAAEL